MQIKKSFILVLAVVASVGMINLNNLVYAVVPGNNQRISLTSTGGQASASSSNGIISANGKAVAFDSSATNILPTGGKGSFVRNIATGSVGRINLSTAGVIANADTYVMRISSSGRYVVFKSTATNLIDGTSLSVTASNPQLYLRDTQASTTTLLTKNSGGAVSNGNIMEAIGVSSDGRFVGFSTNASNLHPDSTTAAPHLFMLDRSDNSLSILDRKTNGAVGSTVAAPEGTMSCDGSLIAFSYGSNLIVGDTDDGHIDVYLLDRRGGLDKMVNITKTASRTASGPSISCSGDFIGFKSIATNIDPAITVPYVYNAYRPYVYDRVNESYHFVAVTNSGTAVSSAICSTFPDGLCVYPSDAGVATFIGNDSSLTGASGSQVYIRDIYSGTTELLSRSAGGVAANNSSYGLSITADGENVSYSSASTNLVSGDTNGATDTFMSATGH